MNANGMPSASSTRRAKGRRGVPGMGKQKARRAQKKATEPVHKHHRKSDVGGADVGQGQQVPGYYENYPSTMLLLLWFVANLG